MRMRFSPFLCLSLLAAAGRGSQVPVDLPHSVVEISVHATVGSFVTRLRDFDVSITASPADGPVTGAVFRCAFASITTGDAGRDRDMNDWQQTDRFPAVMFTLEGLAPAGDGRAVASGTLSLHGVQRPLRFPVSIGRSRTVMTIDGDAAIDTREYGLPVIRKFMVLRVDPVVRVHVHLEGKVAGP